MSPVFTRDQTRELLRARNVGEAAIERALNQEFGTPIAAPVATIVPVESVALPFRLIVPWSLLCSDNEKETAGLVHRGAEVFPRKLLTARYKTSKNAIRDKAKIVAGGRAALGCPLAIVVEVWLPPAHRNDAINFAKVVGDALQGVVYVDDNQLHDSRWLRRGVDIDAPRAELTITAL